MQTSKLDGQRGGGGCGTVREADGDTSEASDRRRAPPGSPESFDNFYRWPAEILVGGRPKCTSAPRVSPAGEQPRRGVHIVPVTEYDGYHSSVPRQLPRNSPGRPPLLLPKWTSVARVSPAGEQPRRGVHTVPVTEYDGSDASDPGQLPRNSPGRLPLFLPNWTSAP